MKRLIFAVLTFFPLSAQAVVSDEFECQISKTPLISLEDPPQPVWKTTWKTAANRRQILTLPPQTAASLQLSSQNVHSGEQLSLNLTYRFTELSGRDAVYQTTCFTGNLCEGGDPSPTCKASLCLSRAPGSPGTEVSRDAYGHPIFNPNESLTRVINTAEFAYKFSCRHLTTLP